RGTYEPCFAHVGGRGRRAAHHTHTPQLGRPPSPPGVGLPSTQRSNNLAAAEPGNAAPRTDPGALPPANPYGRSGALDPHPQPQMAIGESWATGRETGIRAAPGREARRVR